MRIKTTLLPVLLVILALCGTTRLQAQPGIGISYTVSQPLMPMPAVTAATTSLFTAKDDTISAVTKPAGFLFTYGGRNYDGFVVSSNGWFSLVPVGTSSNGANATTLGFNVNGAPSNNLANHPSVTGVSLPVIAPLWDNLSSTAFYNYTAGTLIVRWTTVKWDATQASGTMSFSAIMNTATGSIRFVYSTIVTPTAPSASVGITGSCSGDYYSWKLTADYNISPSVVGTAGSNQLTFGSVAGITGGMLVVPTTPSLTVSALQTIANQLTFASTAGALVGMYVNSPFFPAGTTVTAVTATTITFSNNSTSTVPAATSINFSYFPQGTTVSSISGNTITFSNTAGAAAPTTATFRFVTAGLDSTVENNTIGTTPAPKTFYIDWTPNRPWNDNCFAPATPPSVGSFTTNLGASITSTCTPVTWATTHASSSASGNICGTSDNGDVWFVVTKQSGLSDFIVRTAASACSPYGAVAGTSVEVFTGSCGALTSVGCSSANIANTTSFGEVQITGNPCVSTTYFIRVTGDNNESGKFTICVQSVSPAGPTCANPVNVASLPYTASCVSTAGMTNDYNNNGCNAGYAGEDLVYTYTTGATGECVTIATTGGTGSNAGIFVFNGCPGTGSCVGYGTSATANATATVNLAANTTYYFVLDNTSGSLSNLTVNITSSGVAGVAYDEPAGAVSIAPGLPPGSCNFGATSYNNLCASATVGCGANLATTSCGSYNANSDVWFRATVPGTGVLTFNTQASLTTPVMTDPVMAVYTGSCGSLVEIACNDNTTGNYPSVTVSGLIPGSTIYIRVWNKTGTPAGYFQICAATCASPANENCASAQSLGTPSGGCNYIAGTTFCANPSSAVPAPTCGGTPGADVWYTVTVPANGNIAITTAPGSTGTPMTDAAMQIYTGTCGALTPAYCSVSGSAANVAFPAAQLNGTFAAGTVLYIRVWAENNTTNGTFQICATSSCNTYDECTSAVPLTLSAGATPTYATFSNACATTSCVNANPTCANVTSLATVTILNGGAGYTPNTTFTGVTITTGVGTTATLNLTTDGSGTITAATINAAGFGYAGCQTATLNTGSGTPALNTPTTAATIVVGSSQGHNDIWFSVTVPASGALALTTLTGTLTDPVMQIYTGSCGALVPFRCDDDAGPGLAPEIIFCGNGSGVTPGQTLYVRIWPYSRFTADGTFQLAAYDPGVTVANPYQADDPCSLASQPDFPVTFGSCSNYTYMSLRCSSPTTNYAGIPAPANCDPFWSPGWSPSNDIWVRVVVPAGVTGLNFLTNAGTEYDDNMAVYSATNCSTMTQLACDDLSGPGLMPYISLGGLTPGQVLYVRHYPWFGGTSRQGDFYFCVEAACTTSVPNDAPCTALPITVNSGCIYQGPFTNSCASLSTVTPYPNCGAFVSSGANASRDVWFTLTVPASGQVTIDMQSINIPDAALAAYSNSGGCSGTFTQVGCDDNSSANIGMPYLSLTGLTPGSTLYIRVWAKNGLSGSFNLCATDPCPLGTPPNDDPCNAILMTIGTTYTGYNSCSTNTTDPSSTPGSPPYIYPACWTSVGNANTVWYKFVAPSSSVNIVTTLGTLTNTQIALYTSSAFCFSVPTAATFCNDNYSQCGSPTLASQIVATSLAPGQTYYIMLDGVGNSTGTFSITVFDANAALPATPQQDCPLATVICSPQTVFSSPGFTGAGNYCDLGAGGSGGGATYGCIPDTGRRENNSAWFAFNIDTTGVLLFDIVPTQSGANYDWVMWNITGNTMIGGAPSGLLCQQITANTFPVAACNWSTNTFSTSGTTGMNSSGTCVSCGTAQAAYSSPITVTAGETYLMMINNTSGTAAGFTLDFSNTPCVAYVAANPLNWSGGANATWTNSANWGGCGNPDCAVGANILPGINQPVITGTENVNNLTINAGASLTLAAGATLNVCGNFINNGTFTANATSTVNFIGTGVQTISGNFTGTSRFGNLTVNKASGQVNMNVNVEVGGTFTTSSNTSILNLNNKILRLYGNFSNFNGNTTIIGTGSGAAGSTVEFAGNAPQTFTNLGSNLVLNNVTINQPLPGSTVTLTANATSNLILGTSGILTLTSGRFITGTANEVFVQNTAAGGATTGNTNSYVNGWLRRSFGTSPTTYEFAVGDALMGYERATLQFTTAPSSPYQLAMRFMQWGGSNLPLVNGVYPPLECAKYDWSKKAALNHGYWNTSCSVSNPTGVYNLQLYNRSYTNYTSTTSTSYPVSIGQVSLGTTLNFTSTAGLTVGMNVSGTGIAPNSTITALTPTTVTLSLATVNLVNSGDYILFLTAGTLPAGGKFDALTIMKDTTTTGTGGWKMEATCPCNNSPAPPAKPISMRYGYDASTSGFSNFATVQFGTALPIELMSFDADVVNDGNLCSWTTASEKDNDYFELERSYDGEFFESIGTIPGFGPGTTTELHSYSFLDKDPCYGIVYYRLRQVDIDLNSSLSDVIALNCMRSKEDLVLFPNPANDKITYTFFENSDGVVDVQVVDMMGKSVKWERFSVNRGYNSLRSTVDDLAAGLYYLKITRTDLKTEAKIIRFTKR